MNKNELLGCPWCNEVPSFVKEVKCENTGYSWPDTLTHDCNISGIKFCLRSDNGEDIKKQWNTRTAPKPIKCPFTIEKLEELKIRAGAMFPYHPTPYQIKLLCDFAIAQLNIAPKSTEAEGDKDKLIQYQNYCSQYRLTLAIIKEHLTKMAGNRLMQVAQPSRELLNILNGIRLNDIDAAIANEKGK